MSASSSVAMPPVAVVDSPSMAEATFDREPSGMPPRLEPYEDRRQALLREHEERYPGFIEITRRAAALDKITPHLVRGYAPDGTPGWIGSSDPRWLALYVDARRVIGAD